MSRAGKLYQGYTPDPENGDLRRAFRATYGAEPEELIKTGGAVLVGPITPRMLQYREARQRE